jgi:methyl-accepting chemotaxis protein
MRRRGRPLAALCITLLLAAACGSGDDTTQDRFTVDARVALRTYTALVEQHLSSVLTALDAVAATDTAKSGQWDLIRPALAHVAEHTGMTAAVWFVRPDGTYFTAEKGLADANLSDRAYFPRLMAGEDIEGDLVVSKSTGQMSAIVATPIPSPNGSAGGLGASVDLEKVSAMVNRTMALPSSMVSYAIDGTGRTALHVRTQKLFAYPSQTGSPSLASAVRKMLGSSQGTLTYEYEGAERTVVYMKSESTGWIFVLGEIHS